MPSVVPGHHHSAAAAPIVGAGVSRINASHAERREGIESIPFMLKQLYESIKDFSLFRLTVSMGVPSGASSLGVSSIFGTLAKPR